MLQIWKFQLLTDHRMECKIKMPAFADILSVQLQNGVPTIWALVDTEAAEEIRTFHCIMTGFEIPEIRRDLKRLFLSTLQKANGIVIHVFEIVYKQ